MPRFCIPVLSLVFVVWSAAYAQGMDLTDRIQKRYETLQSFRASFVQKLENASSHERQERTGTILFARPRLIRWETTSPEEELLIIGEKMVWDYFPEEETVYRYTVAQVTSSKTMIRFLSGEANLREDFLVTDLGKDGEFQHLRLVPKEPEPNLVEGEIWVRPGQDMLERIKLVDFFGNTNDLFLHDISTDVRIEEKEFILYPPEGTEILEGPADE